MKQARAFDRQLRFVVSALKRIFEDENLVNLLRTESLDGLPKYIAEATFVATQGSDVIGYGQLGWMDRPAGIGDHQMLAVRRSWRGRGIARALKAAQIVWALDNGLTELRTGNEERNAAARAVNAKFPYVPLPDQLLYRGPLAHT